jgi:flagellar biosynthesis protein FlhB
MAEASAQERTEKATPKRRQEARKKGQVAQSREIPSVMILMTAFGTFRGYSLEFIKILVRWISIRYPMPALYLGRFTGVCLAFSYRFFCR